MAYKVDRYAWRESDAIGSGQYGKVYKGLTLDTREAVAIKVIPYHLLKDSYFYNIYQNEVASLRKLKSPYIVKFIDLKQQGDKLILVTEFCEGGDMSSYLARMKRLPESEVLDVLWQCVQAFREMKKYKLLHRDLKPANILRSKGMIKVADYGFSKPVENFSLSLAKSYVGSPIYMSPQVLFKQTYTSKCDVWSLGIMIYQLLYGEVPWNAFDINELARQIMTQPIIFKAGVPISPELRDFLTRCLRYEERDRISWEEIFNHPAVAKAPLSNSQHQAKPMIPEPLQQTALPQPSNIPRPGAQEELPKFCKMMSWHVPAKNSHREMMNTQETVDDTPSKLATYTSNTGTHLQRQLSHDVNGTCQNQNPAWQPVPVPKILQQQAPMNQILAPRPQSSQNNTTAAVAPQPQKAFGVQTFGTGPGNNFLYGRAPSAQLNLAGGFNNNVFKPVSAHPTPFKLGGWPRFF